MLRLVLKKHQLFPLPHSCRNGAKIPILYHSKHHSKPTNTGTLQAQLRVGSCGLAAASQRCRQKEPLRGKIHQCRPQPLWPQLKTNPEDYNSEMDDISDSNIEEIVYCERPPLWQERGLVS